MTGIESLRKVIGEWRRIAEELVPYATERGETAIYNRRDCANQLESLLPELERTREMELLEARRSVAHLLDYDPHMWSTRPCPTCGDITKLIGTPFGCTRIAALAAEREKAKGNAK